VLRQKKNLIVLLLAGAGLVGCGTTVQNPVTGKAERSVMTVQDEIRVGAEQHQQVLADFGALDNPRLQAYVNGIGQKLARNSERPDLQWHFTVLDSPQVNAFALPGGYVYVTRGIMAYMDSEADLAGVIGHEIGHVTARHGAQRATRAQTAGFGVLAATVLGAVLESQGIGGAGNLASQVSQGVAAGYIASYSREQELQADQLGAEYLAKSSYNPNNMVDVIQLLQSQERFADDTARAQGRAAREGSSWLDSHPTNEQRLQQISARVASFQGRYGDDGRDRYLQAIDGVAFGDSRAQGVIRGRNFYHEPLGFAITAPAGWKIENESSSLALLNPQGDAALVLRLVPANAGNDHQQILRQVLKADEGRIERTTINGMPATHFEGTLRNAQGQSQPVELSVVSGPQGRTYILGYAARDGAALQRSQRALSEAERSFRTLDAADRAAARPWMLRVVNYPAGGFAQLARSSPLGANAEQQLRLLNGVYAGGEPRPGQPVKVVQ
jgi:predicted Zn-dependent protease